MALNKFMHSRNPYKNNRPNFKKLAADHEEFRKVAKHTMDGSVSLDFKDAACLRALSQALLKSDFGLTVDFPIDRLIPAIPQRINYLLWLEDILGDKEPQNVSGIDIGCGSSCVYPLLGHKINKWRFVATEIDSVNLKYAVENVERNKFNDSITVLQADDTLLKLAVDHHLRSQQKESCSADETELSSKLTAVDFCMCNPPFFDGDESSCCRDARPEPKHVSTAGPSEKTVTGGEVKFVMKMIDESLELRHKIRIYTSMVGKKSSLSKIKQHLKNNDITNISTTEFCQGRTMRWAVAWTFDENVSFPKSLFQQERSKVKSGLAHTIPSDIKCCVYDIPSITHHFKSVLFEQLQMESTTLHQDVGEFVCIVSAKKNTWSHSRRKRREQKLKQERSATSDDGSLRDNCNDDDVPPLKKIKLCEASTDSETTRTAALAFDSAEESSGSDERSLITFSLELKIEGIHVKLYLKLIDCQQKDMLHQILQYFKNRLV